MKTSRARSIAFALASLTFLAGGVCVAQSGSVQQSGAVTPRHAASWTTNGVIQDAGAAAGGANKFGISELLMTQVGGGSGPSGSNFCNYDNLVSSSAGYHYLCLSPNALGGGLISYGYGGSASPLPLQMEINGALYEFPFVISGIVGPTPTVIGDPMTWANTQGTLAADLGNTQLDIRAYGAKQDGNTDDSTAINLAIQAAAGKNGASVAIYNNGNNVVVASPIVPVSNTNIQCIGNPVILLKSNVNKPIIESMNFESLIGSGNTSGVNNVTINGCVLDGNRANETAAVNPDFQTGISIYGYHPQVKNVIIRNIYGNGIYIGGPTFASEPFSDGNPVEADFENIWSINVGRRGYWITALSDGYYSDLYSVDASQSADNTYNGFQADTIVNLQHYHGWHNASAANRVKYQLEVTGYAKVGMSDLEGGRKQLHMTGERNQIQNSIIYAPFGSAGDALVDVDSNDSTFMGNVIFNISSSTNFYGVRVGASGVSAGGNSLVLNSYYGFSFYSPFNFANDGGNNTISGYGFMASGGASSFGGSVAATDKIDYDQYGTDIHVHQIPSGQLNLSALSSPIIQFANFPESLTITGQNFGPFTANSVFLDSTGSASRLISLGANATTNTGELHVAFTGSDLSHYVDGAIFHSDGVAYFGNAATQNQLVITPGTGDPTLNTTMGSSINILTGIKANGTAGVTCSGSPTSSFATVNGIVTHC